MTINFKLRAPATGTRSAQGGADSIRPHDSDLVDNPIAIETDLDQKNEALLIQVSRPRGSGQIVAETPTSDPGVIDASAAAASTGEHGRPASADLVGLQKSALPDVAATDSPVADVQASVTDGRAEISLPHASVAPGTLDAGEVHASRGA